jgi:large subunit ribosomal protein L25
MATAKLSGAARSSAGKGAARELRRNGQTPAVIYGHNREPQALAIPTRELQRLLEQVAYETTVIELGIDGSTSRTIIREIQRHPFKPQILHVDFQELVAGEKITVNIPLVLVGSAEGVRVGGGILNQVMTELAVTVDPADIPNHIDVDVTSLTIGHAIHVSDLKLPEGLEVEEDEGATVVTCAPPKTEVEPVPAAEGEEASAEPELIRKTKAEDEGEDE